MADLKKYWQELRAIEKGLPDFVWLMSLGNPAKGQVGGRMVEVTAALAAKLLYAKSHRVATPEETEARRSREDEIKQQGFAKRLRDKGIALVKVP